MVELTKEYIENLKHVIEEKNDAKAKELLEELYPADIAELYKDLNLQEAIYLYLLMDGTTMESEYGSVMYIDLYFPGSVNELQAGTYRIGEVVCQWVEFASYTQTDKIYHEIMPGSVTIEKSGDNYTISCSGTADNGESVSCSYTGPVQYMQDEYSEVSYAKRMSARKK